MSAIKLTQIGNSVGVIFPKEMLTKMNVGKGDVVYVTEMAEGGYHLTPYDAAYVALASRLDCPLWTRDAKLIAGAGATARVVLV